MQKPPQEVRRAAAPARNEVPLTSPSRLRMDAEVVRRQTHKSSCFIENQFYRKAKGEQLPWPSRNITIPTATRCAGRQDRRCHRLRQPQGHAHSGRTWPRAASTSSSACAKVAAHWEKAEFAATHDNFLKVMEVEEAAKAGDVVMMLFDELCADIYNKQATTLLTEGSAYLATASTSTSRPSPHPRMWTSS